MRTMIQSDATDSDIVDKAKINWSILALCRFFLAFVVLNTHMVWIGGSKFSDALSLFGGKAAVVGFLIISGYSVTTSLDRGPHQFIKRRFLRIYPAYFTALLCALALQFSISHHKLTGLSLHADGAYTIICNFALMQMYVCKALSFDPVIWSLSIEFSYYILLFLIARKGQVLLTFLGVLSMLYFILPSDIYAERYGFLGKLNMLRYLWPFVLGVWLARTSEPLLLMFLVCIGVVLIRFSVVTPEPLAPLTFIVAIACIELARRGIGRPSPLFDFLGDVSYPLYLIHAPVLFGLNALLGITSPTLVTVTALLAAIAIFTSVEQPFVAARKSLGLALGSRKEKLSPAQLGEKRR